MPEMRSAERTLETGTVSAMWADDMDVVELTFDMRGLPARLMMSKDDVKEMTKMLQGILLPRQDPQ